MHQDPGISHFIDAFARGEVRKIDSWLADTRHLKHNIEDENAAGPKPPGIIPVTLDISGMYNNVPREEAPCLVVKIEVKKMTHWEQ